VVLDNVIILIGNYL